LFEESGVEKKKTKGEELSVQAMSEKRGVCGFVNEGWEWRERENKNDEERPFSSLRKNKRQRLTT
jgi:hypothetical protein